MTEQTEIAQDAPEEAKAEVQVVEATEAQKLPAAAAYKAPDEVLSLQESFNAMWDVAQKISNTDFVPKAYRNKPAQTYACMLQGRALGVDFMTALREVWISPAGSPEFSADLQAGLVRRAGHEIDGEATKEKATLTGKRADTQESMTVEYTIQDAIDQGLVELKDGQPYARSSGGHPKPWERSTATMLWHRATTRLVQRLFPDVLVGEGL